MVLGVTGVRGFRVIFGNPKKTRISPHPSQGATEPLDAATEPLKALPRAHAPLHAAPRTATAAATAARQGGGGGNGLLYLTQNKHFYVLLYI